MLFDFTLSNVLLSVIIHIVVAPLAFIRNKKALFSHLL